MTFITYRFQRAVFFWGVILQICLPHFAMAASDADHLRLCDYYARIAAKNSGVPERILLSITRVETGRSLNGVFAPWPWTINVAGDGQWFDTGDAAQSFAFQKIKQGIKNFDVGCFQLNFHWHGAAFASIQDMFDPYNNSKYAAQFLTSLYRELGSWRAAVAAYHSRTPDAAQKYMKKYDRIYADLKQLPPLAPFEEAPITLAGTGSFQNTQARTALGSLMPLPSAANSQKSSTIFFGARD